jgi:protein O-GlcNAc transferase
MSTETSPIKERLEFAAQSLVAGNLAAAEIACRDILDLSPSNPAALNLLGLISARVGMRGHAAIYFEAASSAAPNDTGPRTLLQLMNGMADLPEISRQPGPRFLVIKSWGFGFWSDVTQVLGSLLLAEITDRVPVTHWGTNSLFHDGSDRDAFGLYFEPVSNVRLSDLLHLDEADFFPPKWNMSNLMTENVAKWNGNHSRVAALYLLRRPEMIAVSDFYVGIVDVAPWIPASHPMHAKPLAEIYRYLAKKYLRPRPSILSDCDAFFRAHLLGAPFVAFHVRGADKNLEDRDLEVTNRLYSPLLASIDPTWRLFLLTDDEQWSTRFKASYGDRVIMTSCQRTKTSTGVHYLRSVDRVRLGSEVMMDSYLALRANRFFGNGGSNVSAIIALLKEWQPGDCILIGSSLLEKRNLYIHTSR